jgi:hypothetical protein
MIVRPDSRNSSNSTRHVSRGRCQPVLHDQERLSAPHQPFQGDGGGDRAEEGHRHMVAVELGAHAEDRDQDLAAEDGEDERAR